MKHKGLRILVIILGVLAFLLILIWPAAPLWARLGVKPFCIQGDLSNLKIVSCPEDGAALTQSTPRPLPTLSGKSPIPIIVDDDGSPDGTVALLYFLSNPLFEVKAVTISPGEAHPAAFAPHIQSLLAGLGRAEIPVGIGQESPLQGDNAFPDSWRKASDRFWGIAYPQGTVSLKGLPAAELIVQTVKNSSTPVMVFVSGTHTNLAGALRLDPGIQARIREVEVMGGSIYAPGNIESDWPSIKNKVAEWNIWVDPLAADEVFASGLPIHLTPLDATKLVTWTKSDAQQWATFKSSTGQLAGKMLQWMLDSWSKQGVFIWDLAAAVNASDPALCSQTQLAVRVNLEAGPEQGRTVVKDGPKNTTACLKPDAVQFKALAAAVLGR